MVVIIPTSEAFVKAVQPKYAVIQVGKNNYGHPTSEVLDRLDNHKVISIVMIQMERLFLKQMGTKWK